MVQPYKKGVRLEYAVRDMLQDLGFWVVRSAGSRGLFDIYGIKDGFVLGVQCKYCGHVKSMANVSCISRVCVQRKPQDCVI